MLRKLLSTFSLVLIFVPGLLAQQSIQQQFDEFYTKETSTWEDFKMIKKPKLKNFWQVVSDTLNRNQQDIVKLGKTVTALTKEVESVKADLAKTNQALEQSEANRDGISFLGILVTKTVYNTIMWLLVAGLIAGLIFLYLMFMRSNAVTRKSIERYETLEKEHEELRANSREKQAKLKRELQTALNTLQENRINL